MAGRKPGPTYEGHPCKYGHTLRSLKTNACLECRRRDGKRYYHNNREYALAIGNSCRSEEQKLAVKIHRTEQKLALLRQQLKELTNDQPPE